MAYFFSRGLSIAALGLGGLLGGCSEPASIANEGMRPGDGLLDLADRGEAILETLPVTNLPEDLHATLAAPFRVQTAPFHSGAWVPWSGKQRNAYRERIDPAVAERLKYHRLSPAVDPQPGGEVRVVRGDQYLPLWDGESEFPAGGEAYLWDHEKDGGTLYAFRAGPPEDLRIEYLARPEGALALYEGRFLSGATRRSALPPASAQRRRTVIRDVSRDVLYLPAPAAMRFPVGVLHGDRMSFVAAVIDSGYERVGDHLRVGHQLSDGVRFRVEVLAGGAWHRVFEATLDRSLVGTGFHEFEVDLAAFLGEAVELRVATDPGEDGQSDFDYALVGGLRLHGEPTRPPGRPHVILIDLDTLRADRLGCYGYGRGTSPNLDAWAAEHAVVYEDTTSTAPWTLPSTASIMTGLAVHQHDVRAFPEALTPASQPLALVLREAGYEARAWTEGIFVKPAFGFDLGFDLYDASRKNDTDWTEALEWIEERRAERPFFLFLHTYYVHAPYPYQEGVELRDPASDLAGKDVGYSNVIEPYRSGQRELTPAEKQYVSDLYDAAIGRLDAALGVFLEALDTALAGQDYVVVITSDHGDEFFEHAGIDHGQSLFRELLRVPLIVRYPEGEGFPPPGRQSAPQSTWSIFPTILDCVGLPLPGGREYPGHSLRREGIEAEARVAQVGKRVRSIEQGGLKLISGRISHPRYSGEEFELYDLTEDPGEQINLAGTEAARPAMEHLEQQLRGFLQRYRKIESQAGSAAVDAADVRDLQALGYLIDEN